MRVKWLAAAALIAAGCGAPAAEKLDRPHLKPGAPIPWPRITVEDAADAKWIWTALDPRGRDWKEKVAEIPARLVPSMAQGLLDGGNFACEPVPGACGAPATMPEPAPDARIDDPCLRRKLALWAIGNRGSTMSLDAAVQIARLPAPEQELHAAVLWALAGSPYRVILIQEIEKAGDEATADAASAGRARPDLDLLATAGVDGAIEELLPQNPGPDRLKAIVAAQGHVRRETWIDVVAEAEREHRGAGTVSNQALDDAIAALVASGDCEIAGAAGVSDSAYRQIAQSVENWNYMACFWISAQGANSAFLRRDLIDAKGLHVLPADEMRAVDGTFEMPFADELPNALEGCTTDDCAAPASRTHFRMKLGTDGRLKEIERYEAAAGGC